MLKVGLTNFDLIKYLVTELSKNHHRKVESLREYVPTAKDGDWKLLQAGQRAQVMVGGKLQFGTEVINAKDGSIAGLLGASPGASTAVPIMLELMEKCFPEQFPSWRGTLTELIPTWGQKLNGKPELAHETMVASADVLDLVEPTPFASAAA
jgi:malate dehydrogenase (quinone)